MSTALRAARRAPGSIILAAGAAALLTVWAAVGAARAIAEGAGPALLAATAAGAATGLGALVLLSPRPLSRAGLHLFIALAAGMMFAAALFSLLLPALAQAQRPWAIDVVIAAALGYAAMGLLDRIVPHRHAVPPAEGGIPERAVTLMVAGLAVHNLPEGFAVGAGFGGGEALGFGTALSIGVQNVPEGLVVATALWAAGLSRLAAAGAALGTGLLEPLGALAGAMLVGWGPALLPVALALAGGAMVHVVVEELLPEALQREGPRGRPLTFAFGFFTMGALVGFP